MQNSTPPLQKVSLGAGFFTISEISMQAGLVKRRCRNMFAKLKVVVYVLKILNSFRFIVT